MPTREDITTHRVARLERLANAGEGMLARLGHLAHGYSDLRAVTEASIAWHKICRDIEIATLLQERIERGWPERAERQPTELKPTSAPAARAPDPGLSLPDLRLPKIPADLEGEFERDLADAAVIVGNANDDPYVRPNFPRLIAKARKDGREAHARILEAKAQGPPARADTS